MPRARAASALLPPAAAKARTSCSRSRLCPSERCVWITLIAPHGSPLKAAGVSVADQGSPSSGRSSSGSPAVSFCSSYSGGVLDADDVAFRNYHGPLHHVLQLPDVARPGVGLEQGQGIVLDALDALAGPLAVQPEEMPGQLRHVLDPLAQRRHL